MMCIDFFTSKKRDLIMSMKKKNILFLLMVIIALILLMAIAVFRCSKIKERNDRQDSYIENRDKKISNNRSNNSNIDYSDFLTLDRLKVMIGISNMKEYQTNKKKIAIAVLDTGVFPHKDLTYPQNRIIASVDLVNDFKHAYDDNGHGTAIAGIIGGNGYQSDGRYKGIMPEVNLVSVKVLNYDCMGYSRDIVEGINWVIANKEAYNIKVLNISIGVPAEDNDEISKASEKAYKSGIFVVTSVGNRKNSDIIKYSPAQGEYVVAVGSVSDIAFKSNLQYSIADFSLCYTTSDGVFKPDFVVPGYNILSLESDIYYNGNGNISNVISYKPVSGTSASAAVVSGIVADLIIRNPNKSNDEIKKLLYENCVDLKENNQKFKYIYLNGKSKKNN